MEIILVILALAGAAAVVAVSLARTGARGGQDVDAVTAAVEALSLERDAALDALRAELAIERERALRATVDTVLSLAGDKLGSQTELASRELHLRSEAIDERVAGMNDELRRVRELVAQLQKDRAEQHGQLVQGIDHAIRASAALTDTAQSLREALSNSRARGQWGERMADDVLRVAGLVEGVSYRRQVTLAGGCRPDFSFVLPRGQLLHMDVKFPLDNYLRALDAGTEPDRVAHTRAFLRDVRARVRELAGRDYVDPDSTVGYVLLFIPNESVHGFVLANDPGLLDDALASRVVLCSPCTLFAVLGVVRQAVDNYLLERTGDEILDCLNGFSKQWHAFSERLDRLGSQFATAQRTWDDLAGTRRRQLQKQLDRVERLRTQRGHDDPVLGDGSADLMVTDAAAADAAATGSVHGDEVLTGRSREVGSALTDESPVDAQAVGGRRIARLRPVRTR